jgi:hypothetical protein
MPAATCVIRGLPGALPYLAAVAHSGLAGNRRRNYGECRSGALGLEDRARGRLP